MIVRLAQITRRCFSLVGPYCMVSGRYYYPPVRVNDNPAIQNLNSGVRAICCLLLSMMRDVLLYTAADISSRKNKPDLRAPSRTTSSVILRVTTSSVLIRVQSVAGIDLLFQQDNINTLFHSWYEVCLK